MGWLQDSFFTLCWNTFVAFLSRGKPNTWLEIEKNGSQQAYLWLSKIKEIGSFTAAGGPCAVLFLLLCQLLSSPPNRTGIQAKFKPAGSWDSGLPPSLGFQNVSQWPIHPWFAMQSCSLHRFFLCWWGKRMKEWMLLSSSALLARSWLCRRIFSLMMQGPVLSWAWFLIVYFSYWSVRMNE